MAKINISFKDKDYLVDESSLSSSYASLQSHFSTAMSGSGAVVDFNGVSYNIDSAKLATANNNFVTHLAKLSGTGSKVVVNGVEYSVDSAKTQGAVTEIAAVLGGVNTGDSDDDGGDGGITVQPKASLNDYSWTEIQAISNSDIALADYNINIGDTITDEEGAVYYLVDDARNKAYGGLVFMFYSGTSAAMSSSNTNAGGYVSSELKSTVDGLYDTLPAELQSAIKTVTITANNGYADYTKTYTASVKLFLPSLREASGTKSHNANYDPFLNAEGSTFDWFANSSTESANRKTIYSSSLGWLRSAGGARSNAFWGVDRDGDIYSSLANRSLAVVPAFVVG